MKYRETYKFADIVVQAEFSHQYLHKQCADYICLSASPDIVIRVCQNDIEREKRFLDDIERENLSEHIEGYLESLAFYRKFSTYALTKNTFLFHASAISFENEAFLFSAPSGTGKSTHASLWKSYYGDKVSYINDDKPLIKISDGKAVVYGTPWNGKHMLSNNISVPIKGICFLKRGTDIAITKMSPQSALIKMLAQVYRPDNKSDVEKTIALIKLLLNTVDVWELTCDISVDSAIMACEAMRSKKQ